MSPDPTGIIHVISARLEPYDNATDEYTGDLDAISRYLIRHPEAKKMFGVDAQVSIGQGMDDEDDWVFGDHGWGNRDGGTHTRAVTYFLHWGQSGCNLWYESWCDRTDMGETRLQT